MQGKFKSIHYTMEWPSLTIGDYHITAIHNKTTQTGHSSHSARKLWEITASQRLMPDKSYSKDCAYSFFLKLPKWFWCTCRFGKKKWRRHTSAVAAQIWRWAEEKEKKDEQWISSGEEARNQPTRPSNREDPTWEKATRATLAVNRTK